MNDTDPNSNGANLINVNTFDCRVSTHLFLRQSHDNNTKIWLTGKNLYEFGIVALPLPNKMAMLESSGNNVTNCVHFEKLMRDQCEQILLNQPSHANNKITKYSAWESLKHSHTQNPHWYLNMIFIDEHVDFIIMMAYCLKLNFATQNVHKYLK